MRLKMKNSWHRYDIDRTRPKHGYTYTKYKTCLSMMMIMFNKQHLSNILRWIYGKVKQYRDWVDKKALFIKSVYFEEYLRTTASKPTS